MTFLSQTVAPSAWVSVLECKANLRVDAVDEDDLISSLADAACRTVQERVGKALGAQTWAYSLHGLSGDAQVALPIAPVTALQSISYQDAEDATQTLDVSDFYLFSDAESASAKPKRGVSWPSTYDRPDALTITFTAGLDPVPETMRQAAQLLVSHWFENRQAVVTGATATTLPDAVEMLIGLDRKGWVGA